MSMFQVYWWSLVPCERYLRAAADCWPPGMTELCVVSTPSCVCVTCGERDVKDAGPGVIGPGPFATRVIAGNLHDVGGGTTLPGDERGLCEGSVRSHSSRLEGVNAPQRVRAGCISQQ